MENQEILVKPPQQKFPIKIKYHIIILESSTELEKACNSKCNVFHRPIWNSTSKRKKPSIFQNFQKVNEATFRKNLKAAPDKQYESSEEGRHLPSCPILCPHFGFLDRVWGELIAVKSIASVNLEAFEISNMVNFLTQL